jgi:3-phosphoshikimate 1-carboxyvinyltransferase
MESLRLEPIRHIAGTVTLPGSKSLSNRVLLLAALARGATRVENLLESDDVAHMLAALTQLGVDLELAADRRSCVVQGAGGPLPCAGADLFLGNAGTAMRPLAAALCLGEGEFHLRGEPRMHERPIGHLVDALRRLGADISYRGTDGYPPLLIRARGLGGGAIEIDGRVSSQFLSAVLIAAPLARGPISIRVEGELVSEPYVAMTVAVMARFGVTVSRGDHGEYVIAAGQRYQSPTSIGVEGDASSASYFLAAAAIRGGSVRVDGVGRRSVQGDVRFVDVLETMGAEVERGDDWLRVSRGAGLRGVRVDAGEYPDAAMTLATTALFATGPTRIDGIGNWRVKETDRLAAMATELRKVGAAVVEGRGHLEITPPRALSPATIDTYRDHRMAMAFALAALGDVPIVINDPGCTSKTFPTFFAEWARLAQAS